PNPTGWVDPLGLSCVPGDCPGQERRELGAGKELIAAENGPPIPTIERTFKKGEDIRHFEKHGTEIAQTLGLVNYNVGQYVSDANSVILNGVFTPELNAYVSISGGVGGAKGLMAGVDRATGEITTLHLKSISFFQRKAPSLGWETKPKSLKTDTIGSNPAAGWKPSPYNIPENKP
uniref:hypothetical protein n=1 Tax=Pseudomonas psychrophila TaxID=122355 RepID=UPI001ED9341E